MVCQGIEIMGITMNFADFLVFPTTCFYHFWSVIFAGLFILLTLFLYNKEREDIIKPDIISSAGTAASAVWLLALIGTLITSTQDSIPMVQVDIFIYITGIWITISGIWFFKK